MHGLAELGLGNRLPVGPAEEPQAPITMNDLAPSFLKFIRDLSRNIDIRTDTEAHAVTSIW